MENTTPRVIDAATTGKALYHMRMAAIRMSQAWDHSSEIERLLEHDVDGLDDLACALCDPTTGDIGDPNEFASELDVEALQHYLHPDDSEIEFSDRPEPYWPDKP